MNRKQLEKLSDSELRKALATARKNRGYKMREMAALMGITISAYSYAESDHNTRPLKPSNRERLIEMLEGEDLTPPEKNDVRAVRVIDSAIASLTRGERKRVLGFVEKKLKEEAA